MGRASAFFFFRGASAFHVKKKNLVEKNHVHDNYLSYYLHSKIFEVVGLS